MAGDAERLKAISASQDTLIDEVESINVRIKEAQGRFQAETARTSAPDENDPSAHELSIIELLKRLKGEIEPPSARVVTELTFQTFVPPRQHRCYC